MQATAAALLLLVLAVVARGGEAREGDGVSARQLLTEKSCKYPNDCDKVLKHKDCDWLPKAHLKCDYYGKKYHVDVKNCFKEELYVSISIGDKCYDFPKVSGDYIGTVELGCGDDITIYGYDDKLKGDGSKSCSNYKGKYLQGTCKTCGYTAKYYCEAKYSPGDKCGKAKGDCALPSEYDHECKCTEKFKPKTKVCRKARGDCDLPEKCTGHSAYCPHFDAVKANGTICGYKDPHKPCDVDDTCDGYSKDCKDKVADKGTVCRPAKGPCDAKEKCNGHSKKCPDDYCVDYRKKVEGPYCYAR